MAERLRRRQSFIDEVLRDLDHRCTICYEPYDEQHVPTQIPACGHIFGRTCLLTWMNRSDRNSNTCPLCRNILFRRSRRSRRQAQVPPGVPTAHDPTTPDAPAVPAAPVPQPVQTVHVRDFLAELWNHIRETYQRRRHTWEYSDSRAMRLLNEKDFLRVNRARERLTSLRLATLRMMHAIHFESAAGNTLDDWSPPDVDLWWKVAKIRSITWAKLEAGIAEVGNPANETSMSEGRTVLEWFTVILSRDIAINGATNLWPESGNTDHVFGTRVLQLNSLMGGEQPAPPLLARAIAVTQLLYRLQTPYHPLAAQAEWLPRNGNDAFQDLRLLWIYTNGEAQKYCYPPQHQIPRDQPESHEDMERCIIEFMKECWRECGELATGTGPRSGVDNIRYEWIIKNAGYRNHIVVSMNAFCDFPDTPARFHHNFRSQMCRLLGIMFRVLAEERMPREASDDEMIIWFRLAVAMADQHLYFSWATLENSACQSADIFKPVRHWLTMMLARAVHHSVVNTNPAWIQEWARLDSMGATDVLDGGTVTLAGIPQCLAQWIGSNPMTFTPENLYRRATGVTNDIVRMTLRTGQLAFTGAEDEFPRMQELWDAHP